MQHYTNQLAKDTNKYIKDLAHAPAAPSQSEQKQRRMHKERLMNEFSTALNNFQAAQRNAAEKEKASVKRARAASGLGVSTENSPQPLSQISWKTVIATDSDICT